MYSGEPSVLLAGEVRRICFLIAGSSAILLAAPGWVAARAGLPVAAAPYTPAILSYERRFLLALLLTWLIELPVLFLLARYVFKVHRVSAWRILGAGLLASGLTLPYLWFLLPSILTTANGIYLGEVLVFLVEALLYRWLLGLSYTKALLLSFTANAISFLLGLFLL